MPEHSKVSDAEIRVFRRFAAWTFLKVACAVVLLFVLVRILIPNLINAHDDALGMVALLFGLTVPLVAGWLVVSLFLSTRRLIEQLRGQS